MNGHCFVPKTLLHIFGGWIPALDSSPAGTLRLEGCQIFLMKVDGLLCSQVYLSLPSLVTYNHEVPLVNISSRH